VQEGESRPDYEVRDQTYAVNRSRVLLRCKTALRNALALRADRDDVYSDAYYAYVDQEAERSALVIFESVLDSFRPASVVDVG
jgi:hypothetical protein